MTEQNGIDERAEMPSEHGEHRSRARKLPAAMRPHMWKPGQSGNPGGRPSSAEYREALALYREASPEAAAKMIQLMRDASDERVAYMAANTVMERAWGKPRDYDPSTEKAETSLDLSRLSPEQRAVLRALLVAATAQPVDAMAETSSVELSTQVVDNADVVKP